MTFSKQLLLTFFIMLPSLIRAEGSREGTAFHLFGAGCSNQLDTYLSPMEYTGPQFSFVTGRERHTGIVSGAVTFLSMLQGTFTKTRNPARTGDEWGGRLAYDAGWHYNWHPVDGLTLKAGGLIGADLGFLYNNRNSNNPAQGRASVDISASAGACYAFRIRQFPMAVRYMADLPVMGCMFSPQFGQSYYELYTGNRDHNVCFSHPGNALSFRHMLTLDFVFNRTTMRIGYMGDVRQSNVNGIKTHDISHSFLIGYVRYFRMLKRNDRKEADRL